MTFSNTDLGSVLMKFCEKPEYARDILEGNIYMKESGYFRQLDNTFRGDSQDGQIYTEEDFFRITTLSDNGRLELEILSDCTYGLPKGDKIPVFCATMLDQHIIDPISDSTGVFTESFKKEISQFGRYVVCIPFQEFIDETINYSEKNHFRNQFGKVAYLNFADIFMDLDYREETGVLLGQFLRMCYKYSGGTIEGCFSTSDLIMFQKNTSYRWQNEWRLLLKNEGNEIIPDTKDHHIMSIGRLEGAKVFDIDDILNATIEL